MDIAWGTVFIASAAIVGAVEWVKYFVKKAPKWIWHALLLPLCVVVAAIVPGHVSVRVFTAGVTLLVVQVGYQVIVKGALGAISTWAARTKG